MKTKICIKCKKELTLDNFYKQSKRNDYHPQCKLCRNKIWYHQDKKKNPERYKKYAHKANIKKRGLTLEEFDSLLISQGCVCAICNKEETDRNQYGVKRLAIDHNHNTGEVRGLLCAKCNRAIGLFDVDNYDIKLLKSAIKYLRK